MRPRLYALFIIYNKGMLNPTENVDVLNYYYQLNHTNTRELEMLCANLLIDAIQPSQLN